MAKVRKKPGKLVINGESYPAVVALVLGRDQLGRPRECRFVYEKESVGIKGGEEFIVVFAHGPSVAPSRN